MTDSNKQKNSLVKAKLGPALGFRTPDHFKKSKFGVQAGKFVSAKGAGFNPAQFKTQHKGG